MISKTSLFNVGIYKATVKRNFWGSVVYFILLFLFTSMQFISNIYRADTYYSVKAIPQIYSGWCIILPMLLTIVVPTIVAMLVYRFAHSKKVAVFIHSIPVSRTSNYISTVAAAFTLMFAPVVANGIILIILSFTVYSAYFSAANCLVWIGFQLFSIFIMFSIATFAAMITGNTVAVPIINFILNVFVIAVIMGFTIIAHNNLYGFSNDGELLEAAYMANPAVWIMSIVTCLGYNVPAAVNLLMDKVFIYFAVAVLIYAVSLVLYLKRAMETAEDIAAFKVLNPIYKYAVTFVGTLGVYSIADSVFEYNGIMFFVTVILLSAVVYFGCEMLLKKTFDVWKSYKGFVVHGLLFGAMICLFVFTSFFGFETRVPDIDDIESVAIYNWYYTDDEPFVDDSDIIEYAVAIHNNLLTSDTDNYYSRIHLRYKLKNGKTMSRVYPVDKQTNDIIVHGLYEYDSYKMVNEVIFSDDDAYAVSIYQYGVNITDENEINQLIQCVRKDVLELNYEELRCDTTQSSISVDIQYMTPAAGNESKAYATHSYNNSKNYVIRSKHIRINENYKNTLNWLNENGYSVK